jgi:hypothetical protein
MAEWLGRGLQILVRRFDSASDLKNIKLCLNDGMVYPGAISQSDKRGTGTRNLKAEVAELAYARHLKCREIYLLWVRVPPSARFYVL